MISVFASPAMLWGLFAAAGLTAIYFLRLRSRRVVVSSLLLWVDQRNIIDGGRSIKRIKTPLLFFIELLIILLLILAAAGLRKPSDGAIPIFIVLDDSYSMRAGTGGSILLDDSEDAKIADSFAADSPRRKAIVELADLLDEDAIRASVIIAGSRPVLLGETFDAASSVVSLENRWTCLQPSADLASAIVLARQLDADARILVVSDREADLSLDGGRIRWMGLGQARKNIAIVGAVRRDQPTGVKTVIEVANYSSEEAIADLVVRSGGAEITRELNIPANEIQRLSLPLTKGAGPLELELPDDSLALDNRVILLPHAPAHLNVELSVKNSELSSAITKALTATGRCTINKGTPQVRFTTDTEIKPLPGCWDVILIQGGETTKPIAGPFVLDKRHPLLEGVTLDGVVMSQDPEVNFMWQPLVSAGDDMLMGWRELSSGDRRVALHCDPENTTLEDSIDFPVMITNILQWRESEIAERIRPNVRLGETVKMNLSKGRKNCQLTSPSDEARELTTFDGKIVFACDRPGRYQISLDEDRIPLVANVLFRDESDLRKTAEGMWGQWEDSEEIGLEFWHAATTLLLIAIVAWILHAWLIVRDTRRTPDSRLPMRNTPGGESK